jgi:hypothetical protein
MLSFARLIWRGHRRSQREKTGDQSHPPHWAQQQIHRDWKRKFQLNMDIRTISVIPKERILHFWAQINFCVRARKRKQRFFAWLWCFHEYFLAFWPD